MKNKSRKACLKRKHEFRLHNVEVLNRYGRPVDIKHPTYVFLEAGDEYIYVVITHSDDVKNHVVIKLRKNPNPKDKSESYYVVEVRRDTKDRFGQRLKGWKIDPLDDLDIQKLFIKK